MKLGSILGELFGKKKKEPGEAATTGTSGTKLTVIAGIVATSITAWLASKGYDVVVEPEVVATLFILIAQFFQRKGTDDETAQIIAVQEEDGAKTRAATEVAVEVAVESAVRETVAVGA